MLNSIREHARRTGVPADWVSAVRRLLDSSFRTAMWHVSCLRGGAGIDAFVLSIFAWALLGFGNVYYALAQRALDKTIAAAKKKSSLALSRSMAYHPEIQHTIAEMVIELESIGPHP